MLGRQAQTQGPSLGNGSGQPHTVIPMVKDGVKLSNEDVAQDPEGPRWRLHVQTLKATEAELHPIYEVLGLERRK